MRYQTEQYRVDKERRLNELYDGNWIVVPNLSRSYGHNGVIGLHLYWQVWNTQRIISLVSLESGDPVIVEEKPSFCLPGDPLSTLIYRVIIQKVIRMDLIYADNRYRSKNYL